MENYYVGVLTGVTATMIIYALKYFYVEFFKPFLVKKFTNQLSLVGTWQDSVYDTSQNSTIDCRLIIQKQKGKKLYGVFEKQISGAKPYFEKRKFEGQISDRFVFGFLHNSTNRIGYSTLLTELNGNGCELIGIDSWYDTKSNKICSSRIHYKELKT